MTSPTSRLTIVRAALHTQLYARTGVDTAAWSDNPTPPCILTRRTGGLARTDFGKNSPQYSFDLVPLVGRAITDQAQERLDEFADRGSPVSIWDALEADRTLGGTCHTIQLDGLGPDQLYTFGQIPGGIELLGAPYSITVYPL